MLKVIKIPVLDAPKHELIEMYEYGVSIITPEQLKYPAMQKIKAYYEEKLKWLNGL